MTNYSTGWKTPSNVTQDSSRSINNGRTCYAFSSLNRITSNTNSYAYIPTSGGIDLYHKSAMIYCSGYNFNIPSSATIKRIYILPLIMQDTMPKPKYYTGKKQSLSKINSLKFKTTSSTSDGGVGTNLATESNITHGYNGYTVSEIKIPYKKLRTENNGVFCACNGTSNTDGYLACGLNLNSSVVNSSNFGCAFQSIGLYNTYWVSTGIACILIKIDYEATGTINGTLTTSDTTIDCKTDGYTIDINPDGDHTYSIVTLTYHHKGVAGSSPTVGVNSDTLLFMNAHIGSVILDQISFNYDTNTTDYEYQFNVYPSVFTGTCYFTVRMGSTSITLPVEVINTGDTTGDLTSSELAKYTPQDQVIVISGCEFYCNNASTYGGAGYILSRNDQCILTNNIFGEGKKSNTAGTDGNKLYINYKNID